MAAVVLQGPVTTAPERIVGPFATLAVATEWAQSHLRPGGYSVAQDLTSPDDAGAA